MADMQYRELPHGGEKISVIGLGMGSIHEGSEMEIEKTLELALENGVIRHLGLSSHDPEIIRRFLDTGLIDMVMFSINPAYDYSTGDYGIGTASDGKCFEIPVFHRHFPSAGTGCPKVSGRSGHIPVHKSCGSSVLTGGARHRVRRTHRQMLFP